MPNDSEDQIMYLAMQEHLEPLGMFSIQTLIKCADIPEVRYHCINWGYSNDNVRSAESVVLDRIDVIHEMWRNPYVCNSPGHCTRAYVINVMCDYMNNLNYEGVQNTLKYFKKYIGEFNGDDVAAINFSLELMVPYGHRQLLARLVSLA